MSIVVHHVSKLYGTQKALDDVSFEIFRGEIAGFIGPNGAGKTTMMKIITGCLIPTEGEVKVNDIPVLLRPLETKRLIGFLPENNPLYPEMYVREYLSFIAGLYHLPAKRKRVEEVIEITGIGQEANKKIGMLSKGYRQRVGLAQAIIHDPEILILDEPTTGLDPNQIIEIRNLISDIGKQKTVMLSTHIMQEVEAICHRVILINKGKIIVDDHTSNLSSYTSRSTQIIQIEFLPGNNPEIPVEAFRHINGVVRVVPVKNNMLLIEANSSSDIRKELFDTAVQSSLTILSMAKQEKSLQEIFNELTRE